MRRAVVMMTSGEPADREEVVMAGFLGWLAGWSDWDAKVRASYFIGRTLTC
jgi:hypothetical protein